MEMIGKLENNLPYRTPPVYQTPHCTAVFSKVDMNIRRHALR